MPPATRSNSETIEVLRRKLHSYLDTAAEAVEDTPRRTRNLVLFFRYLVHARKRLRRAVEIVYDAPSEVHEDLLAQAQVAYLTNPSRFAHVTSRLELLEAWDSLLLDASEKIALDKKRAEAYALTGAEDWNESSAVAIGSRRAMRDPSQM